jgi:hypothetical protein
VVEHLPSTNNTLDLIPSTEKKKKKNNEEKVYKGKSYVIALEKEDTKPKIRQLYHHIKF